MLDVLTLEGDKIAAVTGFLIDDGHEPSRAGAQVAGAEIFARFGLPTQLA